MRKIMTALLLSFLLVGCSGGESESPKVNNSTVSKEENQENKNPQEAENDNNVADDESVKDNSTTDDTTNNETANGNDNSSSSTTDVTDRKEFHLGAYLADHYSLRGVDAFTGVFYEISSWYNDEIERTQYSVSMYPIELTDDQLITGALQRYVEGEADAEDQRIAQLIINTAENMVVEIPKVDKQTHIHDVYWVSPSSNYDLRLMQDREYLFVQ